MNCDYSKIKEKTKRIIESFEHWSRRIIDDVYKSLFGEDYFHYQKEDGSNLIKKDIIKTFEERNSEDSKRFPRMIDSILLEDIAYFLCKEEAYNSVFKNFLSSLFISEEEIRNKINIIVNVRNKLMHSNDISIRESDQVNCYCSDFIECYKDYYLSMGKERDYNVPTIIKAVDSLGNVLNPTNTHAADSHSIYVENKKEQLRSGDEYWVSVIVDPVFDESTYTINWYSDNVLTGTGNQLKVLFQDENVGRMFEIDCLVISNKKWHRYIKHDDGIHICIFEILPPIEDSY